MNALDADARRNRAYLQLVADLMDFETRRPQMISGICHDSWIRAFSDSVPSMRVAYEIQWYAACTNNRHILRNSAQ